MHGFSGKLDFSLLNGSIVQQVCLGQYETQVHLYPDGSLSLKGTYVHKIGTREIIRDRSSHGSNELDRLLGQAITAVTMVSPKMLSISFSNGDELVLIDDSDQYESFVIASSRGGFIVI
jgi:hypothetical protein